MTATRTNISPGENWLEVGAGVGFDFNCSNLGLFLDYTGQYFRADVEIHYATLKARMQF